MSRIVIEIIIETLIMTRRAGTHTYPWYEGVSRATEMPTMPNRKIRNIKTITKKHAGSESYQGMITFLYKGFGSSCIIIASYRNVFKKNQDAEAWDEVKSGEYPHFYYLKKIMREYPEALNDGRKSYIFPENQIHSQSGVKMLFLFTLLYFFTHQGLD